MTSRQKIAQAGFTLVELAIVLLIVGLLISGILKGQELIENSRTTATIQQTKSYEAAINTFRDSFGGLPGDLANAQVRLPGCQAGNTVGCVQSAAPNGGNGQVTDANGGTAELGTAQAGVGAERTQFWLHLALANMITGVQPTFNGVAAQSWGITNPSGRLAGGFVMGYSNGAANAAGAGGPGAGHFVTLQGTAGGTAVATPVISAERAAQIDLKLDDGQPNTGDVLAIGVAAATNLGCYTAAGNPGAYNGSQGTGSVCSLAVRVMN